MGSWNTSWARQVYASGLTPGNPGIQKVGWVRTFMHVCVQSDSTYGTLYGGPFRCCVCYRALMTWSMIQGIACSCLFLLLCLLAGFWTKLHQDRQQTFEWACSVTMPDYTRLRSTVGLRMDTFCNNASCYAPHVTRLEASRGD